MTNKAKKFDRNKPLPALVLGEFMKQLREVVHVGTFGAVKYGPRNFSSLENGEERYAEAHGRHHMDRQCGDLFDRETGELHAAHEIWCKIAELYFWMQDRDVYSQVTQFVIDKETAGYYDQNGDLQDDPVPLTFEERRALILKMTKGLSDEEKAQQQWTVVSDFGQTSEVAPELPLSPGADALMDSPWSVNSSVVICMGEEGEPRSYMRTLDTLRFNSDPSAALILPAGEAIHIVEKLNDNSVPGKYYLMDAYDVREVS